MANSKHAHVRYNILDYCFKNKAFNFNELLEFVNLKIADLYPGEGISERTLREDLKVFRDKKNGFNAPLPDKIRILKYTNTNFSIAQKPLLDYENYLIEASQQLLERFENHPKYNKLSEALIKFKDGEDEETDTSKILFYDQNEEYKGIKYLKPLYLAIKKKQVLQISYKGFHDTMAKTFEFHPHILKQYNRRWFVFGLNNTNGNKEWSIPLDERLVKITILEDENYKASEIDWESFFRTMVGVRRESNDVVKVVLKFYNGRENYFKTKPFHPDYDELNEEKKRNQVFFEAVINPELVQQILSYGGDVEVLEPVSLIGQMKNHSNVMRNYYGN